MLFFNANFICYYFYPTKKREEPFKKDESTRNDSESARKEPAFDSRRSI